MFGITRLALTPMIDFFSCIPFMVLLGFCVRVLRIHTGSESSDSFAWIGLSLFN